MTFALAAGMSIAAMAQTDFRHISYAEGLEAAKAENKLLFVDFYTEWCGPCKMMARDVFPQKEVGDFMNAHFVCLKIDAEKGEGVELAKRHNVRAYPTFILIDANDKEVGRREGGSPPLRLYPCHRTPAGSGANTGALDCPLRKRRTYPRLDKSIRRLSKGTIRQRTGCDGCLECHQ